MVLIYPQGFALQDMWIPIMLPSHQTTRLRPSDYALTQTCRLLRRLASPIFYSRNTFSAEFHDDDLDLGRMEKWLTRLGFQQRAWVRSVFFLREALIFQLLYASSLKGILRSPIVRDLRGRLLPKPVVCTYPWYDGATGYVRHELVFDVVLLEQDGGGEDWSDAMRSLLPASDGDSADDGLSVVSSLG
jgi:hypothetical protein